MKRLSIFIVLLAAIVGVASAKGNVQYQGEVDLGYSFGVGKSASERVNLHTIQGIRVGKYFSAGIGTGFDFYYDFDDSSEMIVPVYLNLKGYYPLSAKVSPYISCDIGVGVGVTGDVDNNAGLNISPAIGVVWGVFKAQVGYNLQKVNNLDMGKPALSSVQVKVGIMF